MDKISAILENLRDRLRNSLIFSFIVHGFFAIGKSLWPFSGVGLEYRGIIQSLLLQFQMAYYFIPSVTSRP